MGGQEVKIRDQLVLQPPLGLVRFVRRAKVLLDQATAGLTYVGGNGQRKRLELAGHRMSYGLARDSVSLSVADDEVELTWQLLLGQEIQLRLEVRNASSHPVHLEEMDVLEVAAQRGGSLSLPSSPSNWRFYQNGWQSWSPAFARHVGDGVWVNPNTADYRTKHQPHELPPSHKALSSEWFTVITSGGREGVAPSAWREPALLFGFTSAADQLGEIRLDVQDRFLSLRAVSYADGALLPAGEKLSSETLLFVAGDDPLALLDMYATRLAEAMHARVPEHSPTGWCTWYYFFGEETAGDVLANLASLEQERLPGDVVLIDDGYEASIGDWLDVNPDKYPQGMKSVAQQIAATGRRPGIWTAPFGVSVSSKVYADHPEWVLRNQAGEPVVGWQHWATDIYALDLSLPAVQAWLRGVFHTLAEDWGFEFFKVDFVFAAALPGVRHDARMTRAQAVRRGLEIIRETIGDRFLLGCGAPLGPSVGVVDGMRIGPDVNIDWKPYWHDLSAPSAGNAMLNAVARSFMHRKLWLNDPDCLLLRPRGQDSNLVLNEVRMLTTIVGLTGGLVIDSDNLPAMQRSRLNYLRQVLPPYGRSAIPVDLFQHERPQQLVLPVETSWGSWTLVALLNWDGRPRSTQLSLSRLGMRSASYHAYDFWRRRYLGVVRDELAVTPHRSHEAVLLLLKPVSEEPQVLSSTFHITQGGVEIKDVHTSKGGLVVYMEKAGKQSGQLLFSVPPEHQAVSALVNGQAKALRRVSTGIWQLSFSLRDRATVEVQFG